MLCLSNKYIQQKRMLLYFLLLRLEFSSSFFLHFSLLLLFYSIIYKLNWRRAAANSKKRAKLKCIQYYLLYTFNTKKRLQQEALSLFTYYHFICLHSTIYTKCQEDDTKLLQLCIAKIFANNLLPYTVYIRFQNFPIFLLFVFMIILFLNIHIYNMEVGRLKAMYEQQYTWQLSYAHSLFSFCCLYFVLKCFSYILLHRRTFSFVYMKRNLLH